MFDGLQARLAEIFKKLKSRGKLTEPDVNLALREVRMALLEADVNLGVVKDFTRKVKERAIGEEIWKSITPGQLVIKFVKDELVELLGGQSHYLQFSGDGISVIMLVGLQGSGKTTTAGKLAKHLSLKGHKPLLVAADIYRPAAVDQLKVLGKQLDFPVFSMDGAKPVDICKLALKDAAVKGRDVIIIDTAGRLQIDEVLMDELFAIKSSMKPDEVLLVVDSMTGQEAVNVANSFNEKVDINGVILTKLDGDARGGAALSIKSVTGKPIKFVGVGEKLDALEPFHPDRMASRILGMGDVLSLIEKAEQTMNEDKARELEKKILNEEFDLEDFLEQLRQMKNMGPLDQILSMMPGFNQVKGLKDIQLPENELNQIEAIICSMTKEERKNPRILNASRKRRISLGSGTHVSDVNKLLKQFDMSRKMMKQFSGGGMFSKKNKKKFKGMKLPLFK